MVRTGQEMPQNGNARPRTLPGGGGGTPLDGLYRYVPRNRVGFLEVPDP